MLSFLDIPDKAVYMAWQIRADKLIRLYQKGLSYINTESMPVDVKKHLTSIQQKLTEYQELKIKIDLEKFNAPAQVLMRKKTLSLLKEIYLELDSLMKHYSFKNRQVNYFIFSARRSFKFLNEVNINALTTIVKSATQSSRIEIIPISLGFFDKITQTIKNMIEWLRLKAFTRLSQRFIVTPRIEIIDRYIIVDFEKRIQVLKNKSKENINEIKQKFISENANNLNLILEELNKDLYWHHRDNKTVNKEIIIKCLMNATIDDSLKDVSQQIKIIIETMPEFKREFEKFKINVSAKQKVDAKEFTQLDSESVSLLQEKMGLDDKGNSKYQQTMSEVALDTRDNSVLYLGEQAYGYSYELMYMQIASIMDIWHKTNVIAHQYTQEPEGFQEKRRELLQECNFLALENRQNHRYLNEIAKSLGFSSARALYENFLTLNSDEAFLTFKKLKKEFVHDVLPLDQQTNEPKDVSDASLRDDIKNHRLENLKEIVLNEFNKRQHTMENSALPDEINSFRFILSITRLEMIEEIENIQTILRTVKSVNRTLLPATILPTEGWLKSGVDLVTHTHVFTQEMKKKLESSLLGGLYHDRRIIEYKLQALSQPIEPEWQDTLLNSDYRADFMVEELKSPNVNEHELFERLKQQLIIKSDIDNSINQVSEVKNDYSLKLVEHQTLQQDIARLKKTITIYSSIFQSGKSFEENEKNLHERKIELEQNKEHLNSTNNEMKSLLKQISRIKEERLSMWDKIKKIFGFNLSNETKLKRLHLRFNELDREIAILQQIIAVKNSIIMQAQPVYESVKQIHELPIQALLYRIQIEIELALDSYQEIEQKLLGNKLNDIALLELQKNFLIHQSRLNEAVISLNAQLENDNQNQDKLVDVSLRLNKSFKEVLNKAQRLREEFNLDLIQPIHNTQYTFGQNLLMLEAMVAKTNHHVVNKFKDNVLNQINNAPLDNFNLLLNFQETVDWKNLSHHQKISFIETIGMTWSNKIDNINDIKTLETLEITCHQHIQDLEGLGANDLNIVLIKQYKNIFVKLHQKNDNLYDNMKEFPLGVQAATVSNELLPTLLRWLQTGRDVSYKQWLLSFVPFMNDNKTSKEIVEQEYFWPRYQILLKHYKNELLNKLPYLDKTKATTEFAKLKAVLDALTKQKEMMNLPLDDERNYIFDFFDDLYIKAKVKVANLVSEELPETEKNLSKLAQSLNELNSMTHSLETKFNRIELVDVFAKVYKEYQDLLEERISVENQLNAIENEIDNLLIGNLSPDSIQILNHKKQKIANLRMSFETAWRYDKKIEGSDLLYQDQLNLFYKLSQGELKDLPQGLPEEVLLKFLRGALIFNQNEIIPQLLIQLENLSSNYYPQILADAIENNNEEGLKYLCLNYSFNEMHQEDVYQLLKDAHFMQNENLLILLNIYLPFKPDKNSMSLFFKKLQDQSLSKVERGIKQKFYDRDGQVLEEIRKVFMWEKKILEFIQNNVQQAPELATHLDALATKKEAMLSLLLNTRIDNKTRVENQISTWQNQIIPILNLIKNTRKPPGMRL